MRNIITDIEALRTPAKPLEFLTEAGVDKTVGDEIIAALKEALTENKDLLAISAPQLGFEYRIFCIKFNDEIKTFINPIVTKRNGIVISPETCASMPGKEILIGRPEEVFIVYYTDEYKYEDNKLIGPAARIFEQQYQMLDGILPDELGLVSDIETDGALSELSAEDFQVCVDMYKQYISNKASIYQAQCANDPEIEAQYKRLRATEAVINGRVKIVEPEEEAKQRAGLAKAGRTMKVVEAQQQKSKQNLDRKAFVLKNSKRRGKK